MSEKYRLNLEKLTSQEWWQRQVYAEMKSEIKASYQS